jgi:hypothetical protein
MAVTRVDYSEKAVAAAHSVLLELVHLLGEYRDSFVLIGGMVPRLLIPQAEEAHIGTLDVDLALDHRRFEEAGYRTVHELLTSRGYARDDQQPFIYRRRFNLEGRPVTVQVDLLSGEYGGTGRSRRTQRVQDVRPRKARGADLAFEHPLDVEISGALPDGGEDKASVRVATIVPFLIMKGMALRDRLKEKDAYDIYYCLRHYPGRPWKRAWCPRMRLLARSRHEPVGAHRHAPAAGEALERRLVAIVGDDPDVALVGDVEVEHRLERRP